jgi:hypothetical protein
MTDGVFADGSFMSTLADINWPITLGLGNNEVVIFLYQKAASCYVGSRKRSLRSYAQS